MLNLQLELRVLEALGDTLACRTAEAELDAALESGVRRHAFRAVQSR